VSPVAACRATQSDTKSIVLLAFKTKVTKSNYYSKIYSERTQKDYNKITESFANKVIPADSIQKRATFEPGLPDGIISYQKIPIWVYFGGPWNGKYWYILWQFGTLYGNLVFILDSHLKFLW
jgi:hypothetical protein